MALPAAISVSFDYSAGATFGYNGFVIGDSKYGILGTNTLGTSSLPEPVIDLTPNVYHISITRGRNIQRDTYEVGTAVIRVLDPLSYFNPQNTASPYYGYLAPLRKIRVSATTATTQKYLFSGYITDYKYTYPVNQDTGYVDISASDGFRLFQMANISTVTGGVASQTTSARVSAILDQVSFPASMRTISTGLNTCIADPGTNRTSLAAIKNAEVSETGAFYMNGSGTAIFKNRTDVMNSLSKTPVAFNQTGGIPYRNLIFAFDDKLIINQANFGRVGGTVQSVQNTASVNKYFPHSITQTDLVAETDSLVNNIALEYVATRQDTSIRIDEMVVDLLDPAVPTDTMIGLDYFDNLLITNIQPDGSTIVKNLQYQGIQWDITPNKMMATITTLEPIADGFIVGSSYYGIIGTNTLSYQEIIIAANLPAATGDVLTASTVNGLVTFTINADATVDYTTVLADAYQVLQPMNKATAIAFKIPTNASVAFPVGTAITILNKGVGLCTISATTSGTTTVLSAGAVAASPTLAQYKTAVCIKTATDAWYVVGGIA